MAAQQELDALTVALTAPEWRWLTAIAAEQALPTNLLGRLGGDPTAFVTDSLRSGLLVAISGTEVCVAPQFEQLVLRASDDLADIAEETHALLETRSVAHLASALQCGDLQEFLRRSSLRRLPRTLPYATAVEALRASVCEPFDAEWFERTWGDRAIAIGTRVLRESLDGPSPCGALYGYLRAQREALDDDELNTALAEHAFLRGEIVQLDELAGVRHGYRAAARYLDGDVTSAHRLLDLTQLTHPTLGRGKKPEAHGVVSPLLALLLVSRDNDAAIAGAKKLISGEGPSRGFRTLLKYLARPGVDHRRIDVHQLEAGTGAWELLLHAFTVALHLEQPWARASWAQHVARRSLEWREAGYAWLGKQGLLLAHMLNPEYCARELLERGIDASVLRCRPRELSMWDLVSTKPDWKKTLDALAKVSDAVFALTERTRRVAWFIDMTDGSVARPALQEHRDEGGFTAGQRVAISELYELRKELPPEDQRVLEHSRETRDGRRELTPEAYEALIGHPRVLNGARGQQPVEVVRGTCRVETEDDGGHIRIVVEPAGASLGVNVVAESEARLVVYRVSATMQKVIDALPHGVRIPRAHEADVAKILGRLAESVEVRSAQLAAERTVESDTTVVVRIAPRAGAWMVQLGVRPFGSKGRFFVAGSGRSALVLHGEGERLRCVRDFDGERARADALIKECTTLTVDQRDDKDGQSFDDGFILGEEEILALLSNLRDALTTHVLEWPESTALNLRGHVTRKSLHGRLRSNKGWYLATGGVRIDEVTEVSLSELVRAPTLGNGRFVRLANGDYLEVEARIRSVLASLASAKPSGPGVALHRAAVAAMRDLTETFAIEPDVDEWLKRVDSLADKTYPVPPTLKAELRPYQLEGFRWLSRLSDLGVGACLADDMGLGKTVQLIALLLTRASEGPALVVAPTSVCGNWVRELQRFAPSLVILEHTGPDRALEGLGPGQVVICSYAVLQQDEEELAAIAFATAILDEAQFIKNAESLRARAAYRINATQRIASTGTPVENHYGDLWSIFQFLNPGLLGDWAPFKRRFVNPKETGSSDGGDAPEQALRRLIQPYVLRRRKAQVLTELPPLTEVQHDVHLSPDDAMRYALLRKQIHDKLFTAQGRRHSKLEVLAELSRLRRFCCHPRLIFPDAPGESAKITTFLELVEELRDNGHRALVFSQYVDFLSLVREQLDDRAIRYEYLDGSTPTPQRQGRVDAFQSGSASLFLISLKAGGFGLNLTAADYVIHLDPWWNPAVEAQATDRAHRIGQDRRVTVYRLVTKNTIEEHIIKMHGKKQRLARALLDDEERTPAPTAEELVSLLEG